MVSPLKVIIFIVASALIAWVSKAPLRHTRSHGFYRFFAWEGIVVLVLLNVDYWFREPVSTHQVVSWLLLIVCTYWVVHGVHSLHSVGKPSRERNEDPTLLGIEKTTELVTIGAYRYIRHPLYSSLLFLTWGAFFKHFSWVGLALAVISTFFLTMTAKSEEAENMRFFGAAYRDYMRRTKMFVPLLF